MHANREKGILNRYEMEQPQELLDAARRKLLFMLNRYLVEKTRAEGQPASLNCPDTKKTPELIQSVSRLENCNAAAKRWLENELMTEIGLSKEAVRRLLHIADSNSSMAQNTQNAKRKGNARNQTK